MITTPVVDKQRPKSYYLGQKHAKQEHDRTIGNSSVRIDQKKRSHSKLKGDKNKSLEKDVSANHSKFFKTNKSNKKVFFHSI